jgi:hypothetical protein
VATGERTVRSHGMRHPASRPRWPRGSPRAAPADRDRLRGGGPRRGAARGPAPARGSTPGAVSRSSAPPVRRSRAAVISGSRSTRPDRRGRRRGWS